ncbi:putative transcription factor bHLH family [Medicago truncatula]|uniref:Basic helix loop helix (BHLH) DNA-binding family protein n=1 Tax=Medicago truncatula TaxID=3880 RepID=A0A072UKL2_MEDTR|nr:transcription factor bHLH18 [Medicago truncatula]KEH30289.1 basic helix loop helix (bHLH) DNA-binding family protein [Medicago truncatula]RHN61127.1 putative transcription factor bHLH family [Medicago truncatula]
MEEINNPAMKVSSISSWLTDLEMDEYNIFAEECNLNFLDADVGGFLSQDISNVFQEQNKQQCLSLGSTSTNDLSKSFIHETIDNSDKINKSLSPNLSPSFQFPIPKENETISMSPTELENMNHSTETSKGSLENENLETKTSKSKRPRAHGRDHIMAERNRREKLTQTFIALAALVPNLKKMDKLSVLVDTIKYMKELKNRLEVVEEQNKKKNKSSTKPCLCSDEDSSSCDDSVECVVGSPFQVEARVLGKQMLIRIQCQEHKGLLVKIMVEIQRYQLFVVNSSVLPFGESTLDITIIAQLGEGYNLSTKELVKNVRMAVLKFLGEAYVTPS